MQKDSRLFDDMARMMSGAANMAFDVKREMEAAVARQMEAFLSKTSLVTREEFEAVRAMAIAAREENEALRAELEALKGSATSKKPAKPASSARKSE